MRAARQQVFGLILIALLLLILVLVRYGRHVPWGAK
jgi:hypothetical protein